MFCFPRLTAAMFVALISAAGAHGQASAISEATLVAQAEGSTSQLVVNTIDDAIDYPARLQVHQVSLEAALSQLYRDSGIPLLFSPTLIPTSRKVDCDCLAVSVGDALE